MENTYRKWQELQEEKLEIVDMETELADLKGQARAMYEHENTNVGEYSSILSKIEELSNTLTKAKFDER
tara:strand:- start:449 stop:655 length:207 start_codon:yes stop_codon:yes gene_type:complete